MTTEYDENALARALKFFSYKNSKEWAKSLKLDPTMGAEMLNSMFRTEMLGMEKVLAEQLNFILAAGDIQTISDLLPKLKGAALKMAANILYAPEHASLLSMLLEKFQASDFTGRKAILNACERIGDFYHYETLNQIQNSLNLRKKPAKNDEELSRLTKKILENIIDQDVILKVLKNSPPSVEAIREFSIQDIHPRLIQLPVKEMLAWMHTIQEDTALKEALKTYALSCLASPNSSKKTKMPTSVLRYCTAIIVVMGYEGKDKLLINSLCKLGLLDQQALLAYVSDEIKLEVLKKLLGSVSTVNNGLWHLEQNIHLTPLIKDRLIKTFEETNILSKARIGYLLIITTQLPGARTSEYLKRISLYLELSDPWTDRTDLYLELTRSSMGNIAPALHRCQKRDALFAELVERIQVGVLDHLDRSLKLYQPDKDSFEDLLWLIHKRLGTKEARENIQPLQHAILSEVMAFPNTINQLIHACGNDSTLRQTMASIINQVSINRDLTLSTLLAEAPEGYKDYAGFLVKDWQKSWQDLSHIIVQVSRVCMEDNEFNQSFQQAIQTSWDVIGPELKLQVKQVYDSTNKQSKILKHQLTQYREDSLLSLQNSLRNLLSVLENAKISNFTSASGYIDNCLPLILEVFDQKEKEMQELCDISEVIIENPRHYQKAMEQAILYQDKLEVFSKLKDAINYRLVSALSLNLERIFLMLQNLPTKVVNEVQNSVASCLCDIDAIIVAPMDADFAEYDPEIHRSNQTIKQGDKVRVIFPGMMMSDGTVVRHAMVVQV